MSKTKRRKSQRPPSESQSWEVMGKILDPDYDRVDTLVDLIQDKGREAIIRCAALDRYASVMGKKAESLVSEITTDSEEDDDLRSIAFQWFAAFKEPIRTRGAVRVRGAARTKTRAPARKEDWRRLAEKDTSARVRWLATLGE